MMDIYGRAIAQINHNGFNCYQLPTGEFGMVKDELAAVCGIVKNAIAPVIKNTDARRYAPEMTPFIGVDVELTRIHFRKVGSPKVLLRWEFCEALITHYKNKASRQGEQIITRKNKEKSSFSSSKIRCINAERVIENDREYFILENGEIGMSHRGLARASNEKHGTIHRLVHHVSDFPLSDEPGKFTTDNIVLSRDVIKNGKPIVLLRMDFCEAAIAYFARLQGGGIRRATCINADRIVKDGREYFVLKNGECGMSITGLAKASGVPYGSVYHLMNYVSDFPLSENPQQFTSDNIVLSNEVLKSGRPIVLLRMDFCEAAIAYFARCPHDKTIWCKNARHVIEDGREYFVLPNGERGMSKRGLARACNVNSGLIHQLIERLSKVSLTDGPEHFTKDNIVLTTEAVKKGKHIVVLRMDFCEATIAYFAQRAGTKYVRHKKRPEPEILTFDFTF
jgi:hypothetical protein